MGYYINPKDQTKEEWLRDNGVQTKAHGERPEGFHFVCLVNNPGFTAAGIAFNERERQAFAYPDGRPKVWYLVPDEKLIELHPHLKGELT